MLAMLIWRLGAIFLVVNTVWGLDYQQYPSEEYIYQQQPLQHYDGYEVHRQYRSAGDEPTTVTPSVTLKHENLSENQTLDSDVGNNSTHTNGSITLVTDMPVKSTSMASTVPSLLVGRDTSKSVLESSDLSSMEQLNVTTERVNSTSDNSTVEEIKILKRRQAQQVLIQQVPVQPQQVPLSVFQPLPVQRSQFIQAPPTLLFPGQPGQPALVQVPFGQAQFVPSVGIQTSNQLRFVQPQILVPQQVVPTQNSQASITQPPMQLPPKSPPKLSLNPVPLPPTISLPHPNMTIPRSDNGSQANAVKTREANANRVVPKAQPPMSAFKSMVSPMPSRPTPPPAPVRVAPVVPTTTTPLQTPVMMQMPVQPMVRPQLQGQQSAPQSQQAFVQNTTPLPRGLMVSSPLSLEAHNSQPTMAVKPNPFPTPTTLPLPPQTGQRSGSPMNLQPQQQQPPQLTGQAIPAQVAQRSEPQMDQSQHPLPLGQSMNQPPSSAQHLAPPVNQPTQPQPMRQAPANQPPSPQSMGQVQQQTMVQPVGPTPQVQAVQRSGPVMDQSLQQQPLPVGQSVGQVPPAQRSGSLMGQPQQPTSVSQPMGQTSPPPQTAQRSGPPMDQAQMLHQSQSMNQAPPDAQRSGPPMNQPPQPQPMSQTQVAQQPGPQLQSQPVGQTNAQAVQRSGPPMDQSLHQQPLPVGQAPPSQVAQRSGSPMDQPQQPTSVSQPMGQAPPTQGAQRSGPPMDQPQILHPSQSMNQGPDPQRSAPPMNQQSQPQPMGQSMGQPSPAQVAQRTGPLLVNQPPLPITSQQLGQPLGLPNSQPPPPPPPPPQPQQLAQQAQQMGLNQQPPQPGPPIAPRINSPMNPPAPSPMMDFPSPQSIDGASQFNQRSVQDGRGGHGHGEHQMNSVPSNKERHLMKRSVGAHRMRRQVDAVAYPSKEAYDSYVVNNYRNLYDEVYPTYTPPVYTTTTAAAPKYEYYIQHY